MSLLVDNETAGLLLSNYHTVTTLVAHLYVESQRAGFLGAKWLEMDQMIQMHLDIMFAGRLPLSASEAYIRFTKLMGLSTSKRPNSHQRGLPYKEPQYACTAASSAIRPFLDHAAPFHTSLIQLEILVQRHREAIHHESKHKRRHARRKLTPLQFLKEMEDFLPQEIAKIRFDYITLTKNCYMLMKKFREGIKRELGIEHSLYSMKEDSIQPYYPMMVMNILKDGKEDAGQMRVVTGVLKKYLELRSLVTAS
jgi:hypothetical protein